MASKRGPISSTGTTKVAERLRRKIQDGDYYEALQTYKALYSRYRAQGRHQDALELVYEGAVTLLQHEQWECGHELAVTVVSFYKEVELPVTMDTLERINRLFNLYGLPTSTPVGRDAVVLRLQDLTDINPRELFIRAALKWSSMVDNAVYKYGHPKIHQLIAKQYWKEKQFPLSADHFLYAEDTDSFSEMLTEFSTYYGYSTERDLFITRAVLQLLVLKQPEAALKTYRHYISVHPQLAYLRDATPPYEGEPSLNFAWFLIHSAVYLTEFTVDVLEWIKTNYKGVIDRDPSFAEYIEKIGTLYCGVPPKDVNPGANGLLGLLGGPGSGGLLDSLIGSFSGEQLSPTAMAIEEPHREPQTMDTHKTINSDDVLD